MGPCRTHNENIRLHTERTPCRVEDQWSGLMKGGWCAWWLERKRDGEWGRELWCWLSNTLCTVPNPLTHREVTQIYTEKRKAISVVAFTHEPVLSGSVFLIIYLILIFHFFCFEFIWQYFALIISYYLLYLTAQAMHLPSIGGRFAQTVEGKSVSVLHPSRLTLSSTLFESSLLLGSLFSLIPWANSSCTIQWSLTGEKKTQTNQRGKAF